MNASEAAGDMLRPVLKVDPINNGKYAALALNSGGVGFVAYVQDEEWSPNLKIAMQSLHVFLPMIKK